MQANVNQLDLIIDQSHNYKKSTIPIVLSAFGYSYEISKNVNGKFQK